MVFSASLSHNSFSCLTQFPQNFRRNPLRVHLIRAVKSTEPEKKVPETKTQEPPVAEPSSSSSPTASPKVPKKPVYSMKKGQIVRVDKEKYLNSVNLYTTRVFLWHSQIQQEKLKTYFCNGFMAGGKSERNKETKEQLQVLNFNH
ncbi:NAD(P)H-quinone oxidoreductase subunit O [Cucumis melo var. makuwa]|uniref:NAD(P)H-quinone oxidoreductase subunit O n=1 Tax=Cucumis melo var. makuwa TaxID=1194695 RepID=A0A5D3DPT1_CUCMM|nr:NAD(P)H-quinone oxidoreductase subunit O [Cucumis melo var. makuwa]TYK25681.1 NAD(P)H-quinone oxidoreductase subunit O [Cucumis melo var. makuwa]